MMLTESTILKALEEVTDRETGKNVVAAGMISHVSVKEGGKVGFVITIAPQERAKKAWLQAACERAVAMLPGVNGITAVLTAQSSEEQPPAKKANWNREPIAGVRRVVAVASGKGGVGKSTTAVNLAHAFVARGLRVGLLDADIYGPSIPRMMGLKGAPEAKNGLIIPPIAYGIVCMSMGLLVGEESALVWRGPQMSKALHQLLRGVAWGTIQEPLDVLLIDMPPGTGDVHLSLVQQAPVDGAVIVTTPQDVAVADARKCIDMFRKTRVPVLGVIENMSGFTDPATGAVHAIFGTGGGQKLATEAQVSLLGQVPLITALREASDAGECFADTQGIYAAIAEKLTEQP